MTKVIGVYDSDIDLEHGLNELRRNDFSDEVRVLGQKASAAPDVPAEAVLGGIGAVNSPTNTGSGVVPLPAVIPAFAIGDDLTATDVSGVLDDDNIGGEEAEFYADRVRRGGKLVVVETTADRADKARSILARTNAANWTRKR